MFAYLFTVAVCCHFGIKVAQLFPDIAKKANQFCYLK